MKLSNESNLVKDKLGNVDVNYYISQAHSLRGASIEAHSLNIGEKAKRLFNSLVGLFSNPKHA